MYKFEYAKELPCSFTRNGKPVDLGSIWVAKSDKDVETLTAMGVPYIKYKGTKETLTRLIVLPFLQSLFPGINWNRVVKPPKHQAFYVEPGGSGLVSGEGTGPDDGVSIAASDYREFTNGGTEGGCETDINDWFGQLDAVVDIVKLQSMELLPKFVSDIVTATYTRGDDLRWESGYNKKRALACGNYTDLQGSKNLLIIDISGSIPRSVSSTMLALADTLRTQMSADLIITGSTSKYWAAGEDLPSDQQIRASIGLGNESEEFHQILQDHVLGKTWDNVVAFGDNDSPFAVSKVIPTQVGKLYSYRVPWGSGWGNERPVGYCRWVQEVAQGYEYEWDTEWVKDLRQR